MADPQQLTYDTLQDLCEFEQWQIERELNLLQLDPDVLWRPFETLSGGEQTKVLLALLFIDEEHFPLIDEPTNHLDITARAHVAAYLKRKKALSSSAMIDTLLTKWWITFYRLKKPTSDLSGNFSVYEEQKQRQDQFEQEQNVKLKRDRPFKANGCRKAEWSRGRERDKLGSPTKRQWSSL